ncbi:hypothetical protein OZ411_01320 [Bradyrhizobium sp. Arg237L]|uniref:hypothetical protein n=1 Tax=Bradyrhizobium sp. Arg237L TaxID=3003352 RepID=UPI00249DF61E|nr:hypothetical protein [Bradyrhizobium sp. Arg237L]MDI4231453.1 hypothetical protein [Bradyrhizobium sp. Arg237L]
MLTIISNSALSDSEWPLIVAIVQTSSPHVPRQDDRAQSARGVVGRRRPPSDKGSPMTDFLDLSATRPLDSFVLEIRVPGTTQKTGWKIELAGPAHDKTIAASDEFQREQLDKERAIEMAQVNGRKWKGDGDDVADRRRRNVRRVCSRIVGWSPNPVFKFVQDAPIAFSVEAATDLFLRPELGSYFVQVTDYLNSEAAFMPPSETI